MLGLLSYDNSMLKISCALLAALYALCGEAWQEEVAQKWHLGDYTQNIYSALYLNYQKITQIQYSDS